MNKIALEEHRPHLGTPWGTPQSSVQGDVPDPFSPFHSFGRTKVKPTRQAPAPLVTSFSTFFESNEEPETPMQGVADGTCIPMVPSSIQAKPDIRAYPKITGNLNKWKVERDQFIAIATSQKILSLLMVKYKPPIDPDELLKHQEEIGFCFQPYFMQLLEALQPSR